MVFLCVFAYANFGWTKVNTLEVYNFYLTFHLKYYGLKELACCIPSSNY